MRKIRVLFALLPVLLLAGCCTDENGITYAGDCPVKEITVNATFQCNGASCGNNISEYNSTGINVWSYKNSGSNSVNLNVSIYAMPDREITIVYTNEGSGYVTLPKIAINTALKNEFYPLYEEYNEDDEIHKFREPDFIRDFIPAELIEKSDDDQDLIQAPLYAWAEGNKRNWYSHQNYGATTRATTLRKQLSVNGRTINLWVEDSEYNTDVAAKINDIASYIGTIYTGVVSIAGEPWGTHRYSNIIASNQPFDIVFCNLNGAGGYFWSYNNYKTSIYGNSNQAVVVFVHIGSSKEYMRSTTAHELIHAINFYQRFVLMDSSNGYATFLEEMTAVMMEDVVAGKISYNYATNRYNHWLNAPLYQQDITDWKTLDSSSYSVASSFGSFLLRQYGIDFYKTLLKTSGSSTDALDKAIKVYDGGGLAKALRNWGASIAMFPAANTPKGFGYPARSNDNGFNLVAFDGNSYKSSRKLPTSSPATLAPNTHFPFLRKTTTSYTYNEQFAVPSGVGVSVVVK